MADTSKVRVPSIDDMLGAINGVRELMDENEEFRLELTEGHTSGNPMVLGPRLPSAEEWAELQIKGAKDNAQKWLDRTTHPKKNFKEEALRTSSVERYHNSMERVLSEKRWEGGMELVNESDAMDTIKRRGSAAYSKGVEDRRPKILARVKELHSDRLALAVAIDTMPVSTDDEREAKMIANVRGLKAIGTKRRGG